MLQTYNPYSFSREILNVFLAEFFSLRVICSELALHHPSAKSAQSQARPLQHTLFFARAAEEKDAPVKAAADHPSSSARFGHRHAGPGVCQTYNALQFGAAWKDKCSDGGGYCVGQFDEYALGGESGSSI